MDGYEFWGLQSASRHLFLILRPVDLGRAASSCTPSFGVDESIGNCRKWRTLLGNKIAVVSHERGLAVAPSLVAWSENGMHAFPISDRAGIYGYVERGAHAPLPKVDGWRAARDLESPPSGFGLAMPIGSTVRDLLLRSGEEAWWRHLLVLRAPPVRKITDWH